MKPLAFTALFLTAFVGSLEAGDRSAQADADRTVRVCIVTGVDERSHDWKTTGPILREMLEQNRRLEVRIIEDPEILGTNLIDDYDVLFLHFKNYTPLTREAKSRENLVRFVKKGGGLVMFHFACGAFQEWPEFVELAGRVWNPKKRSHDPRGPFMVRVIDAEHPIMQGVQDFEITDELYTCLDGSPKIHVIAAATSKVDGKEYPMAFVRNFGQGRVFHIVLGHDKKAIEAKGLERLLQQGVLWSAEKKQQN